MLTEKTKIEFIGAMKDLGGKLKAGDTVSLWLAEGSKEIAVAVHAQHNADVSGKIAAVSADGKTLTVEVPGPGRGEVTKVEVKLTDKTKMGVGGRGGELKPIVGFLASVWLETGSKDTAAAIQIGQPRADAQGSISAISADGKTITVMTMTRGGEGRKEEIKLTDATKFEFIGAESKDKKLKVGYIVAIWFKDGSTDTAALVLANVQRKAPDLGGIISAISADGKTITLENRKRGEDTPMTIEIKVTPKTELEFSGTDKAEEKKLTVGYRAAVWLQEGSKDTAAVIHAAKPGERGR